MAQFFVRNKDNGEWEPVPLQGRRSALVLDAEGNCSILSGTRGGEAHHGRLLGVILASDDGNGPPGREDYLLLIKPKPVAEILVNGDEDFQATGFRSLQHQDELLIGARERFYFSTESPARIVPFPNDPALADMHCRRCKMLIEPGTPAVLCACSAWYHESPERPCFTYAETCAACGCSTDLSGALTWSPADLEHATASGPAPSPPIQ